MRIAFCWPEITGYMAACWRQLAACHGHELLIIAARPGSVQNYAFDPELTRGLRVVTLAPEELEDVDRIASLAGEFQPEVVYFSGWQFRGFLELPFSPALRAAKFIMGMDNQRKDTWRQKLARLKVGRVLDRVDRVVVPGERAWQFARYLKVPETKIRRGLYGIDAAAFAPAYDQRRRHPSGWPRSFLYVGLYRAVKGVDLLIEAYREYRRRASGPWPLTCCGRGELSSQVASCEGTQDLGFVQPAALPSVMANHGAFVLASRNDQWPLVLVEACAAGLPVLCTEACGSAVELIRPCYNGLTVPSEDTRAFAAALGWLHAHHRLLPEMGARARHFAAAYSAEAWAERWDCLLRELSTS